MDDLKSFELDPSELESVSGSGFWATVGYAAGYVYAEYADRYAAALQYGPMKD